MFDDVAFLGENVAPAFRSDSSAAGIFTWLSVNILT